MHRVARITVGLLRLEGPLAVTGRAAPRAAGGQRGLITAVFEANHGIYGYRRVHAVVARSGEQVSLDLVRQEWTSHDYGPPADATRYDQWWPGGA